MVVGIPEGLSVGVGEGPGVGLPGKYDGNAVGAKVDGAVVGNGVGCPAR